MKSSAKPVRGKKNATFVNETYDFVKKGPTINMKRKSGDTLSPMEEEDDLFIWFRYCAVIYVASVL